MNALLLRQRQTKRRRISMSVINNAAAGPMLSGLDQFFLLAPFRLST